MPSTEKAPMIQVIPPASDSDVNESKSVMDINSNEISSISWNEKNELSDFSFSTSTQYGFNNLYSSLGAQINLISLNLLDIPQLDSSTPASRRRIRLELENIQFDHDHYM